MLELQPDEPLVADDPRVVTGHDHVRVARSEFMLGPVLVSDVLPWLR
jgi:hypothetical protein